MADFEIILRNDAKEKGLIFFYTGLPCKNNHVSQRNVNNGLCVDCQKNRLKRYRQTEKGKAKAKREMISRKEYSAKWRKDNKEKCCAYSAKYREKNPEKVKNYEKIYRITHKNLITKREQERWSKNKEILSLKRKNHQKANKEMWASYSRNRRAIEKNAEGFHSAKDVEIIIIKQKYKCAFCLISVKDKYHVDHIVALSKGGTNWPKNLQILCPSCNSSKNNKDPIEWANQMGKLL